MSHEIFGQRFLGREKSAWHNLGTVFGKDEQLTLLDAMERVIDYKVEMYPVYARVGGQEVLIPNRQAIIRTPTHDDPMYKGLDVVSNSYKLVNDWHLGEIFNDASKFWKVETMGVLNDGKRMFATLDAGMVDIKGDIVHQYFLIYDDKGGRTSTKCLYTPVRVVCNNTLSMGMSDATYTANISHVGKNMNKIQLVADTVMEMQESMLQLNQLFGIMANTPFDLDEFKTNLINKLYPLPTKPSTEDTSIDVSMEFEKLLEKQKAHQDASIELFNKFNDEQPSIANTKWSAWNAITELEDWKAGRGQRQWTSAVFGQRAAVKSTAFDLLVG